MPQEKPEAKEQKEMTIRQIKQAIIAEQAEKQLQCEQTTWFGHPAWVFLLSGYEMENWRLYKNSEDPKDKQLATAKLVQLSLCDKNGNRFYEEKEITHIAGLKPGKELDHICNIALRINGYGNEGLDEILKNLLTILGEDGLHELQEGISAQLKSCSKDTKPTS